MGARGIKPAPTALKLLRGEKPCRINQDQPKAPFGAPECPDDIDPEVKQVWARTVITLHHMDLLSSADGDTLLAYCEAVVTHRRASRMIRQDGVLTMGSMGSWVKNPACTVQNEAATQIARYSALFGLTPSARSEIRMGKVKGGESGAKSADRFLTG